MENITERRTSFLYVVCGPYSLLFLLYVFFGYYTGVRVLLPNLPHVLAAVCASLGCGVVFVLALHLAATMRDSLFPKKDGSRAKNIEWLIWFPSLFVFSGVGFILASLFVFEGPSVVRDGLKTAIVKITQLEATADQSLPVPAYDNALANLKNDKIALHDEITNPLECGVGPGAQAIIADIRKYTDYFPMLNGSLQNYNCNIPEQHDMISQLADRYDDKVDGVILNLPNIQQFSPLRIPDRKAFDASLHQILDADIETLTREQSAVAQIWYFLPNQFIYYNDTATLALAAGHYDATYNTLEEFVGANAIKNLSTTLDISQVENIVAPTSLPSNIFSRISKSPRVILYLIAALMADLCAGYLWACTIFVLESKIKEAEYGVKAPTTDVNYLWVPPR